MPLPLPSDPDELKRIVFVFSAFECLAIEISQGVMAPEKAWGELCEAYEAATGSKPPTAADLPKPRRKVKK